MKWSETAQARYRAQIEREDQRRPVPPKRPTSPPRPTTQPRVTNGAQIVFLLGAIPKGGWIFIGLILLFIIGSASYQPQPKLGPCHSYTTCEYRSGPRLAGPVPGWANSACATSDGHAVGVELSDWIGEGSAPEGLYNVRCSDGITLQVGH